MDASAFFYLSKIANSYPGMAAAVAASTATNNNTSNGESNNLGFLNQNMLNSLSNFSCDPAVLNTMAENYLRRIYCDSNLFSSFHSQFPSFISNNNSNNSNASSPCLSSTSSSSFSTSNNQLLSPNSPPLIRTKQERTNSISTTKKNPTSLEEKTSNEISNSALLAFKALTNYASPNDQEQTVRNENSNTLSNHGSKFTIADILGFTSIEAIASSFAASSAAQSLILNSKSPNLSAHQPQSSPPLVSTVNGDEFKNSNIKLNNLNELNTKKRFNSSYNSSSPSNFQQINNLLNSNKTSNLFNNVNERLDPERSFDSSYQNAELFKQNNSVSQPKNNQFQRSDKINEYKHSKNSQSFIQDRKNIMSNLSQPFHEKKFNRFEINVNDEKIEKNHVKNSIEQNDQDYDSDDENDDDDNGKHLFILFFVFIFKAKNFF